MTNNKQKLAWYVIRCRFYSRTLKLQI